MIIGLSNPLIRRSNHATYVSGSHAPDTPQSIRKNAGEQSQSWAGGLPLLFEKFDQAILLVIEPAIFRSRNGFYSITKVVSLSVICDRL